MAYKWVIGFFSLSNHKVHNFAECGALFASTAQDLCCALAVLFPEVHALAFHVRAILRVNVRSIMVAEPQPDTPSVMEICSRISSSVLTKCWISLLAFMQQRKVFIAVVNRDALPTSVIVFDFGKTRCRNMSCTQRVCNYSCSCVRLSKSGTVYTEVPSAISAYSITEMISASALVAPAIGAP